MAERVEEKLLKWIESGEKQNVYIVQIAPGIYYKEPDDTGTLINGNYRTTDLSQARRWDNWQEAWEFACMKDKWTVIEMEIGYRLKLDE